MATTTQTWRDILISTDFSAIPDIPSDTTQALQPQYAHAERFSALAQAIHDSLDATPEVENLLRFVADPKTAHGIFLDWIGDRVGASRILDTADGSVRLEDDDYRFLVMLKAMRNITGETSQAINGLLSQFLDVPVWVIDNQDMTLDVRILGGITTNQAAILRTYGLPNRPAGVRVKIYVINPDNGYLGFFGSGLLPFDQGIFYRFEQIYEG